MALGNPYGTVPQLKSRLAIPSGDTVDDTQLGAALDAASRAVESFTQRQFNDAGTATERLYGRDAVLLGDAWVDDFHTTANLVVATDNADDGTYATTWTESTDFQLEPLNGIVEGQSGWPFYRIVPVGDKRFPDNDRRAPLKVTAQWGWARVPVPVVDATLQLAAELFKIKDAPFGVAGVSDWGPIRIRDNPKISTLLAPYRREPVPVA